MMSGDRNKVAPVRCDDWTAITAVHEAGHAVAAVVLGLPFTYATVKPDWKEGTDGHVAGDWGLYASAKTLQRQRELAYAEAVMFLAGAMAHVHLLDIEPDWWRADDRSEEYEIAEETLREVYSSRRRIQERMAEAIKETQQLLREQWGAILALAAALYDRETVEYDDARRIVRAARYDDGVAPSTLTAFATALDMTPAEVIELGR